MAKKLSNRFVGEVFFCTSIFILAALFTVYFSVSAHAAVKKTSILGSGGKTVCRVDLDGDGTKEKLEIQISYDEYEAFFSNVCFLVDGKEVLSYDDLDINQVTADYIALDESNIFLRIVTNSDNDYVITDRFYVYDRSRQKLSEVAKLLEEQYHITNSWAEVKSVTDSKILINYQMQFDEIGKVKWTSAYVLKEGKLRLKSNTMHAKSTLAGTMTINEDPYGSLFQKNQFQAMRKIRFYKNTDLKQLSYTANPKDILKLTKLKYVQDYFYVQFSKGNKTGWMKLGQAGVENPSGFFYGVASRLAG